MKKEHERSLPLALPDDYLLPYGTELSPSSFTKTMDNTYIVDALDSHGNPAPVSYTHLTLPTIYSV